MSKQPLVSVIIPCYNHGKFIEAAIESVRVQPYSNTEIIVVDDGSTDEHTIQVLKRLENEVTVIYQANQGPSVARNNAVKASKGEYILCLDSDNRIRPNTISKSVDILNNSADVGVVYGDGQYYGDSQAVKVQAGVELRGQILHSLIDVCSVFRRKVFDDVGGFDEYMSKKGLEDWDFFITVYTKGWKLAYLPETTFDYRVAQTSRTHEVANNNLDDLKKYVWRKHVMVLAGQYELLYHEAKNLKKQREYVLGSMILRPLRFVKSLLNGFKKTEGKS